MFRGFKNIFNRLITNKFQKDQHDFETTKRNIFYKTFACGSSSLNKIDDEELYNQVKIKFPSSSLNKSLYSGTKNKLFNNKTYEAKWSKSNKISLYKNKDFSYLYPSRSQPLINFLYSRNYFDYCNDLDMLFTKTTLKELLSTDDKSSTANINDVNKITEANL